MTPEFRGRSHRSQLQGRGRDRTDQARPAPDSLRRLASGPRALGALILSAAITTIVGYYGPGLLPSAAAGPPIVWNVLDNAAPPLTLVLKPRRTQNTSPGPACDSFRSWATGLGGVDGGRTSFDLIVQGNTSEAVYVSGIGAAIVRRARPAAGVAVECPTAGTIRPRPVQIDLDRATSGQYITSAADSPFGVTVAKGETEVFEVTAVTRTCDCSWVLQLSLVVGGRTEVLRVTDDGHPFETTAVRQGLTVYQWNYRDGWNLIRGTSIRPVSGGNELPPVRGA